MGVLRFTMEWVQCTKEMLSRLEIKLNQEGNTYLDFLGARETRTRQSQSYDLVISYTGLAVLHAADRFDAVRPEFEESEGI